VESSPLCQRERVRDSVTSATARDPRCHAPCDRPNAPEMSAGRPTLRMPEASRNTQQSARRSRGADTNHVGGGDEPITQSPIRSWR